MTTAPKLSITVFLVILFFSPLSTQAEDLQSAIFATPCAGCHGPDGKSPGSIPSINHLSKSAIIFAMKAFKTDKRPGSVMNRIAKGYTDKEIELMAEYFARINNKD